MRTQQEVIEISKRSKEGISESSANNSNVTKNIKKLFLPDGAKTPKRILIEGAPGIGKTVVAKEIVYQWANREMLTEYTLVFLLYLRDPKVHKIKTIKDLLELFTSEDTYDLKKFVCKSDGKHVAFVFDGFDEYPEVAQRNNPFITDLIKGVNYGKMFSNSAVVVTSRPTATLFLHKFIDRRIEILGFPKEERSKYISKCCPPEDKEKLDIFLKEHPIINNLCYIPLHLTILMFLFKQDSLPETLTEMNKSFIIHIIFRYLGRNKNEINRPDEVNDLADLPTNIFNFVNKLSQLAFEGLQNQQLVFTLKEIKKVCNEVGSIPGAINGFGLLQAVQHYPKKGAGTTTSVNFIHFTMQEYLAAYYVSTLPPEKQFSLMQTTFWDYLYNFMWIMYVGIVGIKSNAFTSFIAGKTHSNDNERQSIYNDKTKCLHLFQCYMEAKSGTELPKEISSIFENGEVMLSNITLLPHHISSLIFFMSASTNELWKVLQLCNCNLGDPGMSSLLEHVIKSDQNISTLNYVDLSGNKSSPWGVYCAIIKNCYVESLTLHGDNGIKEYIKEIRDSLQANVTLQSLTLCKIKSMQVKIFESVLSNNGTLKKLNLSWGDNAEGIKIFSRNFKSNTHNSSSNKVINIDMVYMSFSGYKTDDNLVHLTADCSCEQTIVKNISLSLYFGTSHSLLMYIDINENMSSPWGVYCDIIRQCCVKQLTLHGHEGIKGYVKEIIDSLKENTIIQSLTLGTSRSKIDNLQGNSVSLRKVLFITVMSDEGNVTSSRVVDVKIALKNNYSYCTYSTEAISLPNAHIGDNEVFLMTFGLFNNTRLKKINLSNNSINSEGMKILSECFIEYTMALEYVDLSCNISSPWGAYCAIIKHNSANYLTLCGDQGITKYDEVIRDILQANTKLERLTLRCIGKPGLQFIKDVIGSNATLTVSWKEEGTHHICGKITRTMHEGAVRIDILLPSYDVDCEHSSKAFNESIDNQASEFKKIWKS